MQGVTLYVDVMKPLLKRLGNDYETLGRLVSICLESTENNTIPEKLDDQIDDMLFDAFRVCLNKGFEKVNTNRNNGSKGGRPKKDKEQCVSEHAVQSEPNNKQIKPNTNFDKGEVDENNLQLFLGLLNERHPQKNQTLSLLLNANSSISGFCDTNRINQATREKAWEIYTKGV